MFDANPSNNFVHSTSHHFVVELIFSPTAWWHFRVKLLADVSYRDACLYVWALVVVGYCQLHLSVHKTLSTQLPSNTSDESTKFAPNMYTDKCTPTFACPHNNLEQITEV